MQAFSEGKNEVLKWSGETLREDAEEVDAYIGTCKQHVGCQCRYRCTERDQSVFARADFADQDGGGAKTYLLLHLRDGKAGSQCFLPREVSDNGGLVPEIGI